MFAAPPEQDLEWIESGVEGANRFLRRLWRLVVEFSEQHLQTRRVSIDAKGLSKAQKALRREVHAKIDSITDDIERRQTFNTAVAKMMELLNALQKYDVSDEQDVAVYYEGVLALVKMLNPYTPHICEALWGLLGQTSALQTAPWPQVDKAALVDDEKLIIVQVNGKLRAKLTVPADIEKSELEATALAHENVLSFTEGKTIRKVIIVPGKLVNIVASQG